MFVRGLAKSAVTVLWTICLIPFQLLALPTSHRAAALIPRLYHLGAARILGLRITVQGLPSSGTCVLYVANHASWLDIVALGSILETGFVAKSEVANWPGFGLLAKLQQSVFVDRKRHQTRSGIARVSDHLVAKNRLVLFAEGTSNNGVVVLPFQSSYFVVAEEENLTNLCVQPVSITYTRRAGFPLVRSAMPAIAWYGDMYLLPHLWQMFCDGGPIDVTLTFHPPADFQASNSRKALAWSCYETVSDGVGLARRKSGLEAGS
jgi:lyso-ornithine lipid O-acyltransferase